MKISEHADSSERQVGIRAEDIHRWIDGFFDTKSFDKLVNIKSHPGHNPYEHRHFRHCREAIEEAYKEFADKYSKDEIRKVVECHIRDDYGGYIPSQQDFENDTFAEKYHDPNDLAQHEIIFSKAELAEYFRAKNYSQTRFFSYKKLSAFLIKILLPTLLAIVLFISSIFLFVIPAFRDNMMEGKQQMIRELTAAAISVIEYYIDAEKAGKVSLEDAQARAKDEISKMRYGSSNKDYFWITDMHPRMVMHPYRQDLEGEDLSEYRDNNKPDGKKLFAEFVDIVKEKNEGYLEYRWQWRDDYSRVAPKLSYVKSIPAWNWIIGTGIYLDDVELEMERLSKSLSLIFLLISLGLIGILGTILLQSLRIEKNRIKAEEGLREAKDRYRALVEASNEGYVLLINAKTTFANRSLQKMLGFDEEALRAIDIWMLLEEGSTEDEFISAASLRAAIQGNEELQEGEARIKTKDGWTLDVIIRVSKIFLSSGTGHVISFRPIKRLKGIMALGPHHEAIPTSKNLSNEIIDEIKDSQNIGSVIQSLNRLSLLIQAINEQGVKAEILRFTIADVYYAAVQSLTAIAIKELGTPPVAFNFMLLGSSARREMTMFSDQDNALVFEDVSAQKYDKTQKYFLRLSHSVCRSLKEAGFPYCPGGIMAANPKWCLSLSEWKNNFSSWIKNPDPEHILDLHVFYDLLGGYGDDKFLESLNPYIQSLLTNNRHFYNLFAQNCLGYKAAPGFSKKFKVRKGDDTTSINIKACIKPLEVFARIYAMKNNVNALGTIERVHELQKAGVLEENLVEEFCYIFDLLWRLRFLNQYNLYSDIRVVNDKLELASLTETEQQNLHNAINKITEFQEKLSLDFLDKTLYESKLI